MTRQIETKILDERLGSEIPLPGYATDGAAAMDLRACLSEPLPLRPGERQLVSTGLAVHIADPGLVGIVCSRSGLSLKHGIRVAQGIGVIDSDYTGEVGVILTNDGDHPCTIQPGERIAQLMIQRVEQVELAYVYAFTADTERGEGGFGHTGEG